MNGNLAGVVRAIRNLIKGQSATECKAAEDAKFQKANVEQRVLDAFEAKAEAGKFNQAQWETIQTKLHQMNEAHRVGTYSKRDELARELLPMYEFRRDVKFAGVMLLLTVMFLWLSALHQLFLLPGGICALGFISSIGSLLNHFRLLGVVVYALLLVAGSWYAWQTVSLKWHGQAATAYVTGIETDVAERENGSGSPYLIVTYSYSTPAGQYTGATDEPYDSGIEVGDSLQIYYDVTDPGNSRVGRGRKTWLILSVWLVFAGYLGRLLVLSLREFGKWLRSHTGQSEVDSTES